MPIYDPPDVPAGIKLRPLQREGNMAIQLTPETPVRCLNRGRQTFVGMYDGMRYPIPPHTECWVEIPYGAALLFQKQAVVLGTRDLETHAQESYIGILGVDPIEACTPFTVEDCERFGQQIEAFARPPGAMESITWDDPKAGQKLAQQALDQSRGRHTGLQGGETASGSRRAVSDVLTPPAAEDQVEREIDPNATGAVAGETPTGIRAAMTELVGGGWKRGR